MPAATIIGDALPFGIGDNEAGLVTHAVKVVHKKDKKEGRDRFGNVVAVAYYNEMSELTIEGIGHVSVSVGSALVLLNVLNPAIVGSCVIDEISVDHVNEDFQKTSIKAVAYANLTL